MHWFSHDVAHLFSEILAWCCSNNRRPHVSKIKRGVMQNANVEVLQKWFGSITRFKPHRTLLGLSLFVCLKLYVLVNNFFSHFGTASCVLPVLSNGDEVSCSRTQHRAPGKDRTRNLAIKSPMLSQLSDQCSLPGTI